LLRTNVLFAATPLPHERPPIEQQYSFIFIDDMARSKRENILQILYKLKAFC